ncbi:hypothetical protein M514_24503 [Trichuris suis]|uniref:Uncharacterized protein n=1 Tax=Trichuris suis TaxID=68888 RepID=A0A085N1H7_9BILA|nr:hypothetical protein M514_24503 [Trichuris suis]
MTEHGHTLGQMCSLPGPPRCCRQKAIPIRQDDEPEEGSLQPDVRPGGPTPAPGIGPLPLAPERSEGRRFAVCGSIRVNTSAFALSLWQRLRASYIGEAGNTLAHRYQEHMKALTRYRNAVNRLNIPTHYEDAPDTKAT